MTHAVPAYRTSAGSRKWQLEIFRIEIWKLKLQFRRFPICTCAISNCNEQPTEIKCICVTCRNLNIHCALQRSSRYAGLFYLINSLLVNLGFYGVTTYDFHARVFPWTNMPKRSKRSSDAYKELCRCFCAGKSANNISGHKRVRLPCGGAMVTWRTYLNHQKANTNDGADQMFVDSAGYRRSSRSSF